MQGDLSLDLFIVLKCYVVRVDIYDNTYILDIKNSLKA